MANYLRPEGSTVFERYRIVRVLSDKGMSYVYVCMDESLNKLVCLKEIVKANAGRDGVYYHSLMNEARLLAGLNHSGIPRIISIEEDSERVSILMDLVSGENCESLVLREGPMKESVVVNKMVQLSIILGYLHNLDKPVFYRDLKPANVLLQEGSVKLLDFGISVQITEDNKTITQALGSRGYAAPEQAKVGNPYDLRSDIYSLGATMFMLLTGLSPLKADRGFDVRLYNPTISPGLAGIVMDMMSEDPAERPQSIEEVLASLKTYKQVDHKARALYRRRVGTLALVGVLSLVSLGASAGTLYGYKVEADNQYNALLTKARTSGDLADYSQVIQSQPSKIKPYFEMVDEIKSGDAIFGDRDETILLEAMNTDPENLRDDPEYPRLAFDIGILYWFFYQSESGAQGQVISTKWFQQAVDGDYHVDQAQAFYNMGTFNRDVASAVQTATDTGMYKNYWDLLSNMSTDNLSEVMILQLYNYLLDCITTYTYRLKSDGVPLEEINAVTARVSRYLEEHPQPIPGRPTQLTDQLREKLDGLSGLVNTVYGVKAVDQ